MNPFELQAQFARQCFDLVRSMTTTAMGACARMNEETASLWSRSMPWSAPVTPPPAPFFPFPWMAGTNPFTPPAFPTAFMTNPWPSSSFAPWMTLFTGGTPAFPAFPLLPFAPAMTAFCTPWAFIPTITAAAWTSPFSTPSRNPGAEIFDQMVTNYRTASGYAVAAVIGPLNAAIDPRTYGKPWWQNPDERKKLN